MKTYTEELAAARTTLISRFLVAADGNVSAAARAAGLNRTHFHYLMRNAGIVPTNVRHGNAAWQELAA